LGLCPKPNKLFVKSLTKNRDIKSRPAQLRGPAFDYRLKEHSRHL